MVVGITDILYSRNFFLFQYLLKVIRTYHLLTEATGVSGIFGESTWAIVAFNVLLYMHGSYVSQKYYHLCKLIYNKTLLRQKEKL